MSSEIVMRAALDAFIECMPPPPAPCVILLRSPTWAIFIPSSETPMESIAIVPFSVTTEQSTSRNE